MPPLSRRNVIAGLAAAGRVRRDRMGEGGNG